ncbi:MAG: site-2 protease family protein [Phycisphaeraceae bacterium]
MFFLERAFDDPVFYFTVAVSVIFSIVLHELAHGWAAIWQGDDTPRLSGHMTPDPITHMGPIGFGAVFLLGIGWGAMPVDPSRFRSRHGDAFVASAGPAMNLLLALISLSIYSVVFHQIMKQADPLSQVQRNVLSALFIFGWYNIVLTLLNLLPIVPLDGSRILASYHRGYDRWVYENQHVHQFLFIATLMIVLGLDRTPYGLFGISGTIANAFVKLFGAGSPFVLVG